MGFSGSRQPDRCSSRRTTSTGRHALGCQLCTSHLGRACKLIWRHSTGMLCGRLSMLCGASSASQRPKCTCASIISVIIEMNVHRGAHVCQAITQEPAGALVA